MEIKIKKYNNKIKKYQIKDFEKISVYMNGKLIFEIVHSKGKWFRHIFTLYRVFALHESTLYGDKIKVKASKKYIDRRIINEL
ncbi:hypothetical protein DRO21_07065 [archaeon]|nr:MAG: hypothetical protein DRO21_07065 [archaeon]